MKLKHKKVVACIAVTLSGVLTAGFAGSSLAAPTAGQVMMADNIHMQTPLPGVLESIPSVAEVAVKTQEWHRKAVSAADAEMDVYASGEENAEVTGKMYPNTIFDVMEKGETWSKVSSGNVTGFVKNEHLAFGMEAVKRADEVCPKVAVPAEEGVLLFAEAKEDAEAAVAAENGKSYPLVSEEEDWLKVQDESQAVFYIKKESANVLRVSQDAKTIEEIAAEEAAKKAAEEEARRIEEERKAAEEAARKQAEAEAAAEAARETVQEAAAQDAVSVSGDDQSLLAALIYCEAGGEPYEGQVAVGAVVLNRVRSGSFPNSVREVIYQSGQFGPAITGKLDRVIASGKTTSSCYQAAADALAGSNPVGSALYFGNGDYGQQIGGHWFH